MKKLNYQNCHRSEAVCGLEIKFVGKAVLSIHGDQQAPFSQSHICPKIVALQAIHRDPNRLQSLHNQVG